MPVLPPVAVTVPLLITISPPFSRPRFRIAAELLVVAVTSALMVIVPFTVPIQVFVEVAFTELLIVMSDVAAIATYEACTTKWQLIVTDETFMAYPSALLRVSVLPPLSVKA